MRKILLNKKRGKKSVNQTNFIPVEFNRDISLYFDENMVDTVDKIQVYNDEKNTSTKHRLIFTLYPLCTNVLFNKITEIVYKEGSDDAQILTNQNVFSTLSAGAISSQKLNRLQAIRNTEYSNKKFNFTYHCGADIFNNHLLRSMEDITVQKKKTTSSSAQVYDSDLKKISTSGTEAFRAINTDGFNTIGDVNRTFSGDIIYTYLPNSSYNYTYKNKKQAQSPLYLYDMIKPFIQSCNDGIQRKDGWIGFYNPSSFRIPISVSSDNEEYYVNRCINQKEACEFIDMTPERDLFSITPKKNEYRQRLENNWDYCITYPYKSVYEDENKTILRGKHYGLPLFSINGTPYRVYTANNNIETALFYCPIKHNLKNGSTVAIKFFNSNTNQIVQTRCSVVSVGKTDKTYSDRCFSVRYGDISDYINTYGKPIGFARIVQGYEVEYYFRKFKKIDNGHHSNINKLAFAQTIYGDDITQIVYTDDIDINGLVDNRKRPLTELFLTLIKTNRGHDKWYSSSNVCDTKDIEFSHVFGKVTSGLDLPDYINDKTFPTIRAQHNIDSEWVNKKDNSITIPESSSFIEDNILIQDDEFYGDLVEFNPITLTETILEDVYHRFNTAQRELTNHALYNTLYYDEIVGDIYDATETGYDKTKPQVQNKKLNEHIANLAPEGYIYRPHHRIKIGEFSNQIKESNDTLMKVFNVGIENGVISFQTEYNYILSPNDVIAIVDESYNIYRFQILSCDKTDNDNFYTCQANFMLDNDNSIDTLTEEYEKCLFFKHNLTTPIHAYMLPNTSGKHMWKEVINPSEWSYWGDLYTIPFTNGAFYHHTNVIFPVRRQDPFQKYDMVVKKDGIPLNNNFEIPSNEYDYSIDEYVTTENTSCFA
jgi:hypothetical protein